MNSRRTGTSNMIQRQSMIKYDLYCLSEAHGKFNKHLGVVTKEEMTQKSFDKGTLHFYIESNLMDIFLDSKNLFNEGVDVYNILVGELKLVSAALNHKIKPGRNMGKISHKKNWITF